ncbi:MAG: TROVE domain-containing protein [Planctomycetaceae bacterium]|nr:TROVE domain-containing protein [Planctomycetaceae bacterium]
MPNPNIFPPAPKGESAPQADAMNEAGGKAYRLSDKAALATYCCTGTINDTYYANAETQLQNVLQLCQVVPPEFIAKCAVYARTKGFMKDLPCILMAVLLTQNGTLFEKVFPKVIDNIKMLRSFTQILRSGVLGRKSFGSVAARCARQWFDRWQDANALFNSSVGNNPSIGDIIRLTHPKPKNDEFKALFAYFCGFPYDAEKLPDKVQRYELLKKNYADGIEWDELPDINFQYLTSVQLTPRNWEDIARNASWQTTRMNLNAYSKHGVFIVQELTGIIAERLRDRAEIAKSKVFPYQLLMAYKMTSELPHSVREALQDAMEISTENVPAITGKVIVAVDSSGSMSSSITGHRGRAASTVRCSDVAGLVGAAIKRKNPDAVIIAFDTNAAILNVNPRDSVMTMAQQMSRAGGGTDVGCAIRLCNERKVKGDLLVIVSDNESWFDGSCSRCGHGTGAMQEWNTFKKNNPGAKCVCIDIQPYATTQLRESPSTINVAGFSDEIFNLLAEVASGAGEDTFVKTIEAIEV